MKATSAEPQIATRKGKPVSVINPIKEYQELVERAENADDIAWLKRARRKPLRSVLLIARVLFQLNGVYAQARSDGSHTKEKASPSAASPKSLYCFPRRRQAHNVQMAKTIKKKRTPSAAFMKPVTPDDKLALVVGAKPLPRTELTKKLWVYIRKNGLQDKKVRTQINADDALKAVFNGKKSVSMFEMTKLVSGHLKK